MELQIHGNSKPIQVSESTFGRKYNESLVHQVVTAYLAKARAGTKAQKSRSDAQGGGAKPWRQKGTGRARAGTIRSPLWRGGGVTFAARRRDYSQKVNRKMYRHAMCSILSELVRQDRLVLVESFTVAAPKTKDLVAKLKELDLENVLVVSEDPDDNLYLAARNLHHVDVTGVENVDPVSLIKYDKVLMTVAALHQCEKNLV